MVLPPFNQAYTLQCALLLIFPDTFSCPNPDSQRIILFGYSTITNQFTRFCESSYNLHGHVTVSHSWFIHEPLSTLRQILLGYPTITNKFTHTCESCYCISTCIIYLPVDPPRLSNDNQQVHTLLRIMLLHIHMHYSPLSTRFCGSIYCTHTCNFITNKFTRFCESCHCISTCNLITIVHTLLRINLLHSHMHFQHCPHTLVDQFIASQGCSHTLVNHPCSHFHPIHTHR